MPRDHTMYASTSDSLNGPERTISHRPAGICTMLIGVALAIGAWMNVLPPRVGLLLALLMAGVFNVALAYAAPLRRESPRMLAGGIGLVLVSGLIMSLPAEHLSWLAVLALLVESSMRISVAVALRPARHWGALFTTGVTGSLAAVIALISAAPQWVYIAILVGLWFVGGFTMCLIRQSARLPVRPF